MLSFQSSKIEPLPEMKLAFEKAIKNIETSFDYPDPSGDKELRLQIKSYHPHWKGDVLITNSATEATYLALSQISGGKLALNVPSYFGIIRQAKLLGIEILEWENVEDLMKLKNYDAILLTSNFTPPNGKSFDQKNKRLIKECADNNNAIVIEDNAYEFLSYSDIESTSINANRMIHINSFSKLLSPNLRMGFIIANAELFVKLRSNKITMNLSSSPIPQSIIKDILKNKTIVDKWRKELKERYQVAQKSIEFNFGFVIPINDGGSFIQIPLNEGLNVECFIEKAKNIGVLLDNNKNQYLNDKSKPYLRLHLGALSKKDIPVAIKLLSKINI